MGTFKKMMSLLRVTLLVLTILSVKASDSDAEASFKRMEAARKDLRTCLKNSEQKDMAKSSGAYVDAREACKAKARALWLENNAKGLHDKMNLDPIMVQVYREDKFWNPCYHQKFAESKTCSKCMADVEKAPRTITIAQMAVRGQAKCCFNTLPSGKMSDVVYDVCRKYAGLSEEKATEARHAKCIGYDAKGAINMMKATLNMVTFNSIGSMPNCNSKQEDFRSCMRSTSLYGYCDDNICDPESEISKKVCNAENDDCHLIRSSIPCCSTPEECEEAAGRKADTSTR